MAVCEPQNSFKKQKITKKHQMGSLLGHKEAETAEKAVKFTIPHNHKI